MVVLVVSSFAHKDPAVAWGPYVDPALERAGLACERRRSLRRHAAGSSGVAGPGTSADDMWTLLGVGPFYYQISSVIWKMACVQRIPHYHPIITHTFNSFESTSVQELIILFFLILIALIAILIIQWGWNFAHAQSWDLSGSSYFA